MPNQDWWLVFKTKKEGNAPKELAGDLKEVKKGLAGAVEGLTGMSLASFGVAGAIAGVGLGLKASVGAAMEAENIQADLAATLKSTKGAADLTADEVNRMATEFSDLTGIEDDTIVSAQNMLLTFTNIKEDVFPGATEAVLNMSSKMGGMEQAAIQVGKALNDPIQGVSALRRVGVQLTDAQEKQIKTFVEMGDVASAQKIILGELSTEFGGLAAAMGETTQGKINKAKNAIGNLGESIGNLLLPAIGKGAELLTDLVKGIDDLVHREEMLSDAAMATAETYEDYLEIQNKETGVTRQLIEENGRLYTVQFTTAGSVKKLYEGNEVLSRTQYNVARGMYDIQDEGTRMAAAMSGGMTPAVEELAKTEAELKVEQDRLKDALGDLKELVAGEVGKSIDDYKEKHQELNLEISTTAQKIQALEKIPFKTKDQQTELDNLKQKLRDAQGAMKELDTQFQESSKRMLFDMLVAKAASDGLTQTEVDNLTLISQHWGLVDQATATTVRQLNSIDLSKPIGELQTLDGILANIGSRPKQYDFSVTTTYNEKTGSTVKHGGSVDIGAGSYTPPPAKTAHLVSGYWSTNSYGEPEWVAAHYEYYKHGGSYKIPPGYNENWPVGPGKFASSDEVVTITPPGQARDRGNGPLVGTVIINNGMDLAEFRRMLAEAAG